jgi:integrase/recombinase XerC
MTDNAHFLQMYLDYLKYERGLSPVTLKNYTRDIDLLLKHLDGSSLLLNQVKVNFIRTLIAKLHASGLAGKSIARILSSWRGFYVFLAKHCHFSENPCQGIRGPKIAKSLPKVLSTDEAVRFVDIDADSFIGIRDHAMVELFYSSGLRLAELVGLNLAELDLKTGEVLVTGKGSKSRIVPVGTYARTALSQWLEVRQLVEKQDQPALFITQQGKRLSARAIQYRMKCWSIKQNIPSNVHPHMLRHSFASHVLQSSGDLRAVQELLGHANISTTQIYTHLDFQHLAKVYDKAHPRAKKRS